MFSLMNISLIYTLLSLEVDSTIYKYYKLIYYIYGGIFAKLVGHIQIARLGKFEFDQFRISLLVAIIMTPLSIFLFNYKIFSDIVLYIIIIFLIFYSMFLYNESFASITDELCDILQIEKYSIERQLKKIKSS